MILSKEDKFSDAQAPTVTNKAVTDSESTLDWHSHGNDIDKLLRLFVLCEQTAASNGASTLTIAWLTSAEGSVWTTLKTFTAIPLANLAAGATLLSNEALPDGLLRYNKLTYTVGGADFTTAPKITAYVTVNDQPVTR